MRATGRRETCAFRKQYGPPQQNCDGRLGEGEPHSLVRPLMTAVYLIRGHCPGDRMKLKSVWLAGTALILFAVPAVAHHSFAMFDADKTMEVKATVKELEWTNPHSYLVVVATDEQGKTIEWSLETNSPGKLARIGWRANSVTEGDKIMVTFHPLKDGGPGGQLVSVVLPDGMALNG